MATDTHMPKLPRCKSGPDRSRANQLINTSVKCIRGDSDGPFTGDCPRCKGCGEGIGSCFIKTRPDCSSKVHNECGVG